MTVMRRNRVGRLGWKKWDKVKIAWCTHRQMYRKSVTCELHDSYFRLMTIKHAIPKIEWAIELLYNSVKTGSRLVRGQRSRRQDVVEKATTQQKGPSGPPASFLETSWWEDAGMRTCPREAGPPALRSSSSPGERERHTTMSGGAGKVNMLQSLFILQLPLSHTQQPFQIKWEVYFFKEVFARRYYCVIMILQAYVYVLCVCIVNHIYQPLRSSRIWHKVNF